MKSYKKNRLDHHITELSWMSLFFILYQFVLVLSIFFFEGIFCQLISDGYIRKKAAETSI